MYIAVISRTILFWIFIVCFSGTYIFYNTSDIFDYHFYRYGPQNDLIILGFVIDTPAKYGYLVLYLIINTFIRTLHHEILTPWLINNVQDVQRVRTNHMYMIAYEVTTVNVIYQWLDWLLYMNILLAQIDLVLIEILCNLVSSNITTYYYMNYQIVSSDLLIET